MPSILTRPFGRVLAGVVVLVLLALGWFALQVDPMFSSRGKVVIVRVSAGESVATLANDLQAHGVIGSPWAYRLYSFVGGPTLRIGSYQIAQGSSFGHVSSVFEGPPNIVAIDVHAGQTLHEVTFSVVGAMGTNWANKFAKSITNDVTKSPFAQGSSLEGLIGVGQYIITPTTTPANLAERMVHGFVNEAASVGLTSSTTLNGLNAYQLVIASSIVEKEGYYPVNMPRVARVIYNRLARGGPLQMDATVLYYLGQDGGTVTPADLHLHTPYNTYLNNGLTPTPICAVSTIALNATLHAPPGSWLYFTLINQDGTMKFSTTFDQQLAAEKLAQSRGIG
jgi:UPF0755 protein